MEKNKKGVLVGVNQGCKLKNENASQGGYGQITATVRGNDSYWSAGTIQQGGKQDQSASGKMPGWEQFLQKSGAIKGKENCYGIDTALVAPLQGGVKHYEGSRTHSNNQGSWVLQPMKTEEACRGKREAFKGENSDRDWTEKVNRHEGRNAQQRNQKSTQERGLSSEPYKDLVDRGCV